MWVRRSEHEIVKITRRAARRRWNPLRALLITVFLMLMLFLFESDLRARSFFLWPAFAVAFLILFALLYFVQGRYGLLGGVVVAAPAVVERAMICPRCQKVQLDTESHACSCGGHLENLEHWRWTDDKHPPPGIAST